MKILLTIMLLISIQTFSQQPNCTKLEKTATGLKITNKGMCATKYRIERNGYGDSVTVPIAVNASLTLAMAWCDTLRCTPVTTCPCSCTQKTAKLNYTCTTTAQIMSTSVSRDGDIVSATITLLADSGVDTFDVVIAGKSHVLAARDFVVGVPRIFNFKID